MKTLFLIFIFLFLSLTIFSQDKTGLGYRIQNIPAGKNIDMYSSAVESADFSCYRFKTKSRVFKFEDGAELELFSESQCINSGIKSGNCALNDDTKVENCILKISTSGNLLMEFVAPPSKSTVK